MWISLCYVRKTVAAYFQKLGGNEVRWKMGQCAKSHRLSWFLGRSPFCIRGDATSGRPMVFRALAGGLNPTLHQATNSLGAPELCRSGSTGRTHTTLRTWDRVLRCMGFLVIAVKEFWVNQFGMVNGMINLLKISSIFDLDFKGRTWVQKEYVTKPRKKNRNNNCGIKEAHSEGVSVWVWRRGRGMLEGDVPMNAHIYSGVVRCFERRVAANSGAWGPSRGRSAAHAEGRLLWICV